jgi:hypothetical protein
MSQPSSRSVSRVLDPETARRLRALEQSMESVTGRIAGLESRIGGKSVAGAPVNKKISVTGTQAFILRNQT